MSSAAMSSAAMGGVARGGVARGGVARSGAGVFSSSKHDGLRWWMQWLVFLAAALLIVSRRPDVLTHPQFYAEDGAIWYAQAYNLGWLHSLAVKDGGYLNTLPRLVAGLSLLVSLRWAPLVMNLGGIALQALPVTVLLSSRCASWGGLRFRALMAAIYIALPNSQQIDVVITNAQWHTALIMCLLAFGAEPRTRRWKIFDVAVFLISGLTGPFCIVLLPLALFYWWRRRERWTAWQTAILAFCAIVQAVEMARPPGRPPLGPSGASLPLFFRLAAGQVYISALRGRNFYAFSGSAVVIAIAFLLGSAVLAYTLWKAHLQLRLFVLFAAILFAGSLKSPGIAGPRPAWQMLTTDFGSRYWFFPTLALLWALLWCAVRGRFPAVRVAGTLALLAMVYGVWHDWEYPRFKDRQFPRYAAAFHRAPPGTLAVIPVEPDGWYMRLTKK